MPASKTPFDESLGADWRAPPPRDRFDDKLWSLLPPIDAPYDYDILSRAEADALTEALSDGFNTYLGFPRFTKRNPLPASVVKSSLLSHTFYSAKCLAHDADTWNILLSEQYFNQFPLALNPQRLQIYFQNQFIRFRHQYESAIDRSSDEFNKPVPLKWLYEKPWYEFHALCHLRDIQLLRARIISEMVETSEEAKKSSVVPYDLVAEDLVSEFIVLTGTLGRLAEQYCWRFQYERAVVAGENARKGASAGGNVAERGLEDLGKSARLNQACGRRDNTKAIW
jgi:hypothetical protein